MQIVHWLIMGMVVFWCLAVVFWCLAVVFYLIILFMEWKTGDKLWLARKLWPDEVRDLENGK